MLNILLESDFFPQKQQLSDLDNQTLCSTPHFFSANADCPQKSDMVPLFLTIHSQIIAIRSPEVDKPSRQV